MGLLYRAAGGGKRFYPYFDLPIGVDLVVLAQERWARRLQEGDRFATRVSRESVSL